MGNEIQWGPEIRVDGKRPDFVRDGDRVQLPWEDFPVSSSGKAYGTYASGARWENVPAIRLPADHPHYHQKPTTPERDPALWDRMEAFIRTLAKWDGSFALAEDLTEARAIVAALPKPVDPDEEEVTAIIQADPTGKDYIPGGWLDTDVRRIAKAALQRGRALAAQDAARG